MWGIKKVNEMHLPKIFAKIFVIPYITWLLLLIVLIPVSYGWTFITLLFSMQPFGSAWIWFNSVLLIEPLFGESASVILSTVLGVVINLAVLYSSGFIVGAIIRKIVRLSQ